MMRINSFHCCPEAERGTNSRTGVNAQAPSPASSRNFQNILQIALRQGTKHSKLQLIGDIQTKTQRYPLRTRIIMGRKKDLFLDTTAHPHCKLDFQHT